MCCSCADLFLGFLAILFPPLPVWVKVGLCSADSIINILLCLLGYIPGLLHSWYIIAAFPDADAYESLPQQDSESGRIIVSGGGGGGGPDGQRVAYILVHPPTDDPSSQQQQQQQPPQPKRAGAVNDYGSTGRPIAGSSSAAPPPQDDAPAPPSYHEAVRGDHKIQTQD
ncbi:hypothetical protein GGR56DRAFT_340016 [Xylariaceae sp. FL0804]|nr:hypothetical protein GGR56DRAFT_340016 [Xylariaceae sp. FL0804]